MRGSFMDGLPLSRSAVDRDAPTRDRPGALEEAWADPGTRVVVLRGERALFAPAGERPRLALLQPSELPEPELVVYLGRLLEDSPEGPAGTPVLATALSAAAAESLQVPEERWADLRLDGAELDARDAGLFTQALGLANWHRTHGHSPRSGVATVPGRSGWVRYPEGHEHESSGEHVFPRTDPAIIVGVVDATDRLLLASNVAWPDDRFSVVAGFVEPGESFEAAVRREVFEETAVRVADVQYLGSQPWPFPASIMVGFLADADPQGAEAVPDGEEIREARWFTRDELRDAASTGTVRLPGRTSIARAIIEHWYGGRLEGDW
ncbi:MAG: diphosphatase [Microbacteriaceae bacterium]|nr:diphosphatase [Microbacteriaceae bacterium]